MRRIFEIILFNSLIFSLTACSGESLFGERNEISNIAFVKVIGIDKTKEGDVRVTVTSKLSKVNEQGSNMDNSLVYTFEGKTVSDASNNIRCFADKMLFYGQNDYIVIGEAAAKEDMGKYLDLLTRWHRSRLSAKVMVIKGNTAENLIKSTSTTTTYISERLDNLFKAMHNLSEVQKVTLLDFIKLSDQEYNSAYLPYVQLTNKTQKEGANIGKVDIELGGYVIFKGVSLYGYLDKKLSRGLNWITNQIEQGNINLFEPNGNIITLLFTNSKTKVKASIDKNIITIHCDITCSSNIVEQSNNTNIYTEKALEGLKNQQNEKIKSEVLSVIDYAVKSNNDFLGIADIVYHKYPIKWEQIKNNWGSVFKEINYEISVKSNIERSYIITQPNKINRSDIE